MAFLFSEHFAGRQNPRGADAVVVISTMDFRHELSAKEYAIRLSAHRAVLYVERQAGPEHLLLDQNSWPGRVRGKSLRQVNAHLWVYTPPPLFLAHNMSKTLNALEQAIFAERLKSILKRLDWNIAALLIYQHNSAGLIASLRPQRSAYVIIDDFVSPARGWRRSVITALEHDLLGRVDAVLVASEQVHARVQHQRPDAIRFPSAVDLKLFDPSRHSTVPRLPRSVATVATFDDRIDTALLAGVTRALPDYSFHFFGRDDGGLAPLRDLPNATLHGQVPHADLPRLLAPHPVCLLPYARTPATEGVSSLKLLEYLALGKTVIATPTADALAWAAEIRIGATIDEWIALIRTAANDDARLPERRAKLAEYSYPARFATLCQIVGLDL